MTDWKLSSTICNLPMQNLILTQVSILGNKIVKIGYVSVDVDNVLIGFVSGKRV